MSKYVVIGGVAGGAGVSARLRRLEEDANIIIFERGYYVSYANCGLPYYAGEVIEEKEKLFLMTPEKFKASLNIDVKIRHEVIGINPEKKTVRVKNLDSEEEFEESYDKLVLSPGAVPFKPTIPGIEDEAIYTLRTVSDIDKIKEKVDNLDTKRAVVVGAGFIGMEMAENLHRRGLKVTVVEAQDQIMSVVDYDIAAFAQTHVRSKGIQLQLKDLVTGFERKGKDLHVMLSSKKEIPCDIVIISIGVHPDTDLAKKANLKLSEKGAIIVDEYLNTSIKDIYAVGDAIEFTSPLLGKKVIIPLAGPASKQARICANNIVYGNKKKYEGSIGTSIAKIFDITVATTGLNEKTLKAANIPFKQIVTHAPNHASYYPDSFFITLKALYNPKDGKLLGAQLAGITGVDKRIDVLAAYIKKSSTIYELTEFEHAYAPPFSSAKDPINMIGFIADNVKNKLSNMISWHDLASFREKNAFFLDVRTVEEYKLGAMAGTVNIPHTELRKRLDEVPKDRIIVINCAIGLRAYLAERILTQNGYKQVYNLTGGYKTYDVVHKEKDYLRNPHKAEKYFKMVEKSLAKLRVDGSFRANKNIEKISKSHVNIDACGLQCPGPIVKLKEAVEKLNNGDIITIKASDPGFSRDVQSWCELTGNQLLHLSSQEGVILANIRKLAKSEQSTELISNDRSEGATFIVFSSDMDKVMASFVLANGAAATGKKVTMFFTFWGLSVLRKKDAPKVEKDFMGRMFNSMLPKGLNKLSLSNMNFAGMGPKMMKNRMKDKNVDQLDIMFKQAKDAGVRFVACQMSMDIMGISQEEIIDGVEFGGVATYMQAASKSNINLFV